MNLKEKAVRQFNNHDGTLCITHGSEPLTEAIHFLYYHRWWPSRLIQSNLTGREPEERRAFVSAALDAHHSCSPSVLYEPYPARRELHNRTALQEG